MRRAVESGVVLGLLAALATLPVVANAASEPERRTSTPAVGPPQYLPDAVPPSQAPR